MQVKENYALPIYSKDYVTTISDHEIQFTINDQLFLETLLMEIRGKTISFSSFTKKRNNEKEKNLISEINTLEENYEHNALLINEKKKELENIRNHRLIGSIVRSRAKWTEEGEKPTNYFLNLENRHYTNKIIPKLIKEENQEEIVNQIAILNEIEQFYRKLYDANDKHNDYNLNEILIDPMIKKLADFEKDDLEGQISFQEATSFLKNMANNKSPGSDGFTTEFYKVFWNKIGHFVVRSLNFGYNMEELSITQRQGIITCIPKEGKSKFYLKNWRPITLLNVAYKIGSGCIAQRIKNLFDKTCLIIL